MIRFLLQDYGGFVALMMLRSTEKLVRCAATQTPVIDWSMYGEPTVMCCRFHGNQALSCV